jgi:hypothetical protein
MTKALRKAKNEAMAARMKARGEERTTGRCCICYVLYHADMLGAGFASHRCSVRRHGAFDSAEKTRRKT